MFFPELSITGYEPQMAESLALSASSQTFDVFQKQSDKHDCVIGVGFPLDSDSGVKISMVWLQPNQTRSTYEKQLLHCDELPFFTPGDTPVTLQVGKNKISPAICFESLQDSHAQVAADSGTNIYLASVAKSQTGIDRAEKHCPQIASQHGMFVVMANCIGNCDDFIAGGQTAAWDPQGRLINRLGTEDEGILMVDTQS